MQLAKFLNNTFKNDGFILVDADSKKYIIGSPKNKIPITLKILKSISGVVSLGGGGFINNKIREEVRVKHFSFWLRRSKVEI
jgi:hypothetical protein